MTETMAVWGMSKCRAWQSANRFVGLLSGLAAVLHASGGLVHEMPDDVKCRKVFPAVSRHNFRVCINPRGYECECPLV